MIWLQKLTPETAQIMRKWRNQNREYFRDRHLITYNEQEKWIEKYLKDMTYWYFIVVQDTKPVGCIGFSIVSSEEAHIESVILGEKEIARHGVMSEALKRVMAIFPFKVYTLKVLKDNKKAIHFYEANGFSIKDDIEDCYLMIKS